MATETFPGTSQDTTPAVVSALPLATIRSIVATLQAEAPAEHARISHGVEVLLSSRIVETGELGRYLVQSCRDGVLFYEATSWACSCPGRQRHADEGLRCKHSWALDILSEASAIVSREAKERPRRPPPRMPISWTSTPTRRFPLG
jgi:hypothetical protein